MKYIKQLDSLRAIAVLLVIISHWIPERNIINRIPNGAIGVDIFFVLSGFLITSILFGNRNKIESEQLQKTTALKNFYVRRTLRIFPIYYLTIFILLLISEETGTTIKSAFVYFATYTSNFYFFSIQRYDGMISHLWSLAVEEQFYLIWPWLILLINKKYLLHVISIFILIGVLSQLIMGNVKLMNVLTFTCFDAFGLGAMLAWFVTYYNSKLKALFSFLKIAALISSVLLVIGIFQNKFTILPLRTLVSLISVWVIAYIVLFREQPGFKFKIIFNNRLMIFLGKISYGLYLYHNIIPGTLNAKIVNKYLNPLLPDILFKKYWGQLFLFENAILLLLVSWFSYTLIETRFLRLKRYFQ